MTYRLLGTGVCLLKSALCVRRFHDRKKTGSDMISPATRRLRSRSVFRCIHWFGRETNGLVQPALGSGCFLVSFPGIRAGNGAWVLITSPLLTAFIMSRHLTDLQLLLVLAEMCGLFAVCALPAALEAELSRAIDSGAISTTFGWVRCPSEDGTASNLWRRDALVLGGDLDRFCSDVCGMRYGNRFMAVSQLVPLGAASPLRSRRICYLHCRDPWEAKVFAT